MTYVDLLQYAQRSFDNLPNQFKFYYIDTEGDIISVSSQEDLEEAIECMTDTNILKLIVEENIEKAKGELQVKNILATESIRQQSNPNQNQSNIQQQEVTIKDEEQKEKKIEFEEVKSDYDVKEEKGEDMNFDDDKEEEVVNKKKSQYNKELTSAYIEDERFEQNLRDIDSDEDIYRKETLTVIKQVDNFEENTVQNKQPEEKKIEQSHQEIQCIQENLDQGTQIEQDGRMICYKCEGQQKIKNGKPCKKCQATGYIDSIFMNQLVNLIQNEVANQKDQGLKHDQEEIHQGISCSQCGISPIQGHRYLCFECEDYNLCQTCERELNSHSFMHPMIKIRTQSLGQFIKISQENKLKEIQLLKKMEEIKQVELKEKIQSKQVKYKAKFIRESFAENYTVEQGSQFEKTWHFKNDGDCDWPNNTKFLFTNGEEIGEMEKQIGSVKSQDFINVTIKFNAPSKVGKYCAFYRFSNGDQLFGQKVWCDITVIENESEVVRLQKELGLLDQSCIQDNYYANINQSKQDVIIGKIGQKPVELQQEEVSVIKNQDINSQQQNQQNLGQPILQQNAQQFNQSQHQQQLQQQQQQPYQQQQQPPYQQQQQPYQQQQQPYQQQQQPYQQQQQPYQQQQQQPYYNQNEDSKQMNQYYQQPNQMNYSQYQQYQQPYQYNPQYNQQQYPYQMQQQPYQFNQYNQFQDQNQNQQNQHLNVQQEDQQKSSLVDDEFNNNLISKEDKQRIDYLGYVEQILSKQTKEQMMFLMEMGFLDFKKNEQLLLKHKGDLQEVTNQLALV